MGTCAETIKNEQPNPGDEDGWSRSHNLHAAQTIRGYVVNADLDGTLLCAAYDEQSKTRKAVDPEPNYCVSSFFRRREIATSLF